MPGQRLPFRQCPACLTVQPVAMFKPMPAPVRRPEDAVGYWKRCPSCQHVAPQWAFRTRRARPGDEGPGGTKRSKPEAKR